MQVSCGMRYRTQNPATGQTIETFDLHTDDQIETALEQGHQTYRRWSQSSLETRAALLLALAERLEENADAYAAIMALEMGKPLLEGVSEARKCAWVCRHYAERGQDRLRAQSGVSDGSEAWVRFDPLGLLFAIMPWNFPFWQVLRFAAPALMAGNSIILKHSPNVPRSAEAIAALVDEASNGSNLVQNLFLTNEHAARVIQDPRVQGVTLTGSSRAGKQVGALAGASLKTMVMELGGSDPFIVFEDADVERAAETGVVSRCINSGQSCIAAKRFLVHEDVREAFVEAFIAKLRVRRVGDPTDPDVTIGPLARDDLEKNLSRQVDETVSRGGRVLFKGAIDDVDPNGFFFAPTVIDQITCDMPAYHEELFGPAAVVLSFGDEAEAISIANETVYGLGASVWTAERERAMRCVERIDAGAVFVNGLVKSDPRLPFGGVKDSGFGRELGDEGLVAFTNRKTVWVG